MDGKGSRTDNSVYRFVESGTMLGEAGKVTAVSAYRFAFVRAAGGAAGLEVGLRGAPGETIDLLFAKQAGGGERVWQKTVACDRAAAEIFFSVWFVCGKPCVWPDDGGGGGGVRAGVARTPAPGRATGGKRSSLSCWVPCSVPGGA